MDALTVPATFPGRWARRRGDVLRLVRRRLLVIPLVVAAVSAGIFALAALSPFDPLESYLGYRYQSTPDAAKASLSGQLGLDRPWWSAWLDWLGGAVRGDLGWSRVYAQPVTEVFAQRLPWTLLLSATGLLLALVAGIGLGVAAGLRPGSWLDRACTALGVLAQSAPPFVLALGGITVFAVLLRWFPVSGAAPPGADPTLGGALPHLVLPAVVLAVSQLPWLLLTTRASVADAVSSDAVRGARARGLRPSRVVTRHILPVSLAPTVTVLAARLPELIVGAVLVEAVFGWPGIAGAVVESAKALDFGLLAALAIGTTLLVLIGSLLADAAYLLLDPRVGADV